MNRKMKRLRDQIREAEKKLQHLNATWQDDPIYAVLLTCDYCGMDLEEEDLLNEKFIRTHNDHEYEYDCRFCGSLI